MSSSSTSPIQDPPSHAADHNQQYSNRDQYSLLWFFRDLISKPWMWILVMIGIMGLLLAIFWHFVDQLYRKMLCEERTKATYDYVNLKIENAKQELREEWAHSL